jgi:hypothetical protein
VIKTLFLGDMAKTPSILLCRYGGLLRSYIPLSSDRHFHPIGTSADFQDTRISPDGEIPKGTSTLEFG